MTVRTAVLPFAATAALALSACGSDEKTSARERAEKGTTAAVARAEAGKTSIALVQALATYRSGDHAAAEDQVAEAYLQHFERVEGPLGARDHELTEKLEESINDELRDKMKHHAPAPEVTALVRRIIRDLASAQAKLG